VRSNGEVSLVLTSTESGASNAFAHSLTGTAATSTTLSTAADARIRMGGSFGVGGIELTSSSNNFDNVIDGVSLSVNKVHKDGDAALTLTIDQDKSATKGKAQSFVDAFNALMTSFDSLTASGSDSSARGALAGDSSIRSIESRLNG